ATWAWSPRFAMRTMAPSPSRLITKVPRCQGVRVSGVPCLHPSGGQACLSRVDHDAGSTVGANSRNFMTGARGYGGNMGMVASLRDANHGTLSLWVDRQGAKVIRHPSTRLMCLKEL